MGGARLPADVERRLRRFFERLDRLDIDQLRIRALRPGDADAHRRALAQVELLAADNRRGDTLRDAGAAVEDWVIRVFSDHQYQPTMIGLNWGRSLGTSEDRLEIARTLREAASALVVWDLILDDDRAELLGGWADLAS